MTKQATKSMRKVFAGFALAGALTVPFSGVATATSDGGAHSGAAKGESKGTVKSGGADHDKTSTATPAGLQASCQEKIARRLTDLDRLEAKLAKKSAVVTPEHAGAITAIIGEARDGLADLGAEIGAAATVDALKPLCARIVTDFRIYALRIPQANLAIAADTLVAKQAKFATLRAKLEAAITEEGTPEKADAVAALLSEFDAHVAAMVAAASSVGDPVLALAPADYNADRKVLKPFVATTKEARSEAKLAAKTARKILHLLDGETEDKTGWGDDDHKSAPQK